MAVSLAFTSPVSRLMSVSLSAMFWRLDVDVGFVDLYSRGQSNDIIIYAHHIRCLVKPLEAATFYPSERVDRQFVNASRIGLQLVNDGRIGLQRRPFECSARLPACRMVVRTPTSPGPWNANPTPTPSILTCMPLLKPNAGRHVVGTIKAQERRVSSQCADAGLESRQIVDCGLIETGFMSDQVVHPSGLSRTNLISKNSSTPAPVSSAAV